MGNDTVQWYATSNVLRVLVALVKFPDACVRKMRDSVGKAVKRLIEFLPLGILPGIVRKQHVTCYDQAGTVRPVTKSLFDCRDQAICEACLICFRELECQVFREMKMDDIVLTLHVPEGVAALLYFTERSERAVQVDKKPILWEGNACNEDAQILATRYASEEAYSYS
jgi:hypothetical protein